VLHLLLKAGLRNADVISVEPREYTDSSLFRKVLEWYLGMGECILQCLEFSIDGLGVQNLPVDPKR
jgi:hypothetical protein